MVKEEKCPWALTSPGRGNGRRLRDKRKGFMKEAREQKQTADFRSLT
jgi:hypothetical protein